MLFWIAMRKKSQPAEPAGLQKHWNTKHKVDLQASRIEIKNVYASTHYLIICMFVWLLVWLLLLLLLLLLFRCLVVRWFVGLLSFLPFLCFVFACLFSCLFEIVPPTLPTLGCYWHGPADCAKRELNLGNLGIWGIDFSGLPEIEIRLKFYQSVYVYMLRSWGEHKKTFV